MPQSRTSASQADGPEPISAAVGRFRREVSRKLRTKEGSQEDHLRAPFERLISAVAQSYGLQATLIGETRLPNLSIRPDYAVDVAGSRVGYVELKKPGTGVPRSWSTPSRHDRAQWDKLKLLPNVLYSDGEQFARYSFGELQGKAAHLEAGNGSGRGRRPVGQELERVVSDFLLWEPEQPRSLGELVKLVANLCRLLRDDVTAEMVREKSSMSPGQTFTALAMDWRQVLFPSLTDDQFVDQYAQTITFALLLARVEGIDFRGRTIAGIAELLGKQHSLMGRALTVLTDQHETERSVALTTMLRVLSAVDWSRFPEDSYATLYEDFLSIYDPKLRRKSGVYYTPSSLVSFMTKFVDMLLRKRLGRALGLAEKDVIVVDPAMGTGSFLAEVVNSVAATVAEEEGIGAVSARLREFSDRLIGFENQAAPYAIAELRIHGLLKKRHQAEIPTEERRFLADALDDPNTQTLPLGRMYEVIEKSRKGANKVKRQEPVMVVIGNPPFVDKVRGSAPWIEAPGGAESSPSLDAFRNPGNGKLEYVLSNKYVYFWRWAAWKTFDAHPQHPDGVVALVCSRGFVEGPGFAGMREYLRRTADEGWIIDLSPEGHQPPMDTRFFRGNQQPICIAVFLRRGGPHPKIPARIRRAAVTGTVEQKAAAIHELTPDGPEWLECLTGWSDPFRPTSRSTWTSMPSVADLMPWSVPGIKPNRTWVYAPEPDTLRQRWRELVCSPRAERPRLLKETESTKSDSQISPVPGMAEHHGSVAEEKGPCPALQRVAHRSFDRKWTIADARLHERPRPSLWSTYSESQLFLVEQHAHRIVSGPALVFTSLIPDMDYHSGRGGRAFPLYRDAEATKSNTAPGLLEHLSEVYECRVTSVDLVAYLAAVAGHRGFVERFTDDLAEPGIRIPLTRNQKLWSEALLIGREVVWLHTFGERCADQTGNSHLTAPKLRAARPRVQVGIPDTEGNMPERIDYEEATRTLHVGVGEIAPVPTEVWRYEVSGMRVVKHWFDYRKKNPTGNRSSPLDDTVVTSWTPTMTTELLELLNVLARCVEIEPVQERLLGKIMENTLITIDELTASGVLPVPATARKIPLQRARSDSLFSS